jgi:hypothetical protein
MIVPSSLTKIRFKATPTPQLFDVNTRAEEIYK